MKKINVLVRDKFTLVLNEDALKGDIIDLNEITNLELSYIEHMIDVGKDELYNKKLSDYQKTVEKLQNEAKNVLKMEFEKQELQKLNSKDLEIKELKNKIIQLQELERQKIENEKLLIEKKYQEQISNLNLQLQAKDNETKDLIIEINKTHLDELNKQKEEYQDLNNRFLQLQHQKANLNVKMIGESLEIACDNEVLSYMQNGLYNCTWEKDTTNIKEFDESKGSKADFIFKVYASEELNPQELLTSVCLEMKDENPDSKNKKTNADYYNKLDKNRTKKDCKYAVLVSNLEADNTNSLPIFKVNQYPDMYVVRPGYLMTFLNMVVSLTNRFKDLLIAQKEEKLELQTQLELLEEFESIKKKYLEDPLNKLKKLVDEIQKNNMKIIEAANKSTLTCDSIVNNYIESIQTKLETFEINITKKYKKYNK